MDILRQLTRKFRAQELNDRSHSPSVLQMKEEALDSGTASDEEIVQILPTTSILENGNITVEEHINEGQDDLHSNSSRNSWSRVSTSRGCSHASPTKSFSTFSLSTQSDFTSCTDNNVPVGFAASSWDGRRSVTSSDFERCSLDFEMSSLSELESHSSEEELSSINRDEKRKRSQLSDDSSIFSDDDDNEVNELFQGKNELSFRSLSVCLTEPFRSAGVLERTPASDRSMSPRKRHRREYFSSSSTHRPSLDFYKMQKTCIVRRHQSLYRPRLVKLWIVNGSQGSTKTTFDPSPFCFRSLSWTSGTVDQESSVERL